MDENPYQSPRAASVPDGLSEAAKSEADERAARYVRRMIFVMIVGCVPLLCVAAYLGTAAVWGALFGVLIGSTLTVVLYRRKRRRGT